MYSCVSHCIFMYMYITLSHLQCCGGGEGGCGKEKRGDEEGGGKDGKEAMLQSLILSGCHQITDVGLRSEDSLCIVCYMLCVQQQ